MSKATRRHPVHKETAQRLAIGSEMSVWDMHNGYFSGRIVDKVPGESEEEVVLVLEGEEGGIN